jgi:hypothetical protein
MGRIENDESGVCIRCRGNVFTEPLPSNDEGLSGVGERRQTQRHQGDLIRYLLFFENKGSSLKCLYTSPVLRILPN